MRNCFGREFCCAVPVTFPKHRFRDKSRQAGRMVPGDSFSRPGSARHAQVGAVAPGPSGRRASDQPVASVAGTEGNGQTGHVARQGSTRRSRGWSRRASVYRHVCHPLRSREPDVAARIWLRKALTDVPQDRPQSQHSAEPGDVEPAMAPRVAYGSTERLVSHGAHPTRATPPAPGKRPAPGLGGRARTGRAGRRAGRG